MKRTPGKLRTRFAPEVRFEVAATPFRAALSTELERLKERLLRELLQEVTDPAENTRLRRAANDAAALVWLTPCPALLLPVLFEEKARAARRQAGVRQRSLNLLRRAA